MTSVFVSILSIHNTEYTKHITRTVFLILFSFCLIFAKHCAKATVFKWVCVHSFSMYVCTMYIYRHGVIQYMCMPGWVCLYWMIVINCQKCLCVFFPLSVFAVIYLWKSWALIIYWTFVVFSIKTAKPQSLKRRSLKSMPQRLLTKKTKSLKTVTVKKLSLQNQPKMVPPQKKKPPPQKNQPKKSHRLKRLMFKMVTVPVS